MLWGLERKTGTVALADQIAVSRGDEEDKTSTKGADMGSGEFASALANYKAATLVVAPVMYSRIYAWAKASGRAPSMPFWAAAASALAAEAVHQTI